MTSRSPWLGLAALSAFVSLGALGGGCGDGSTASEEQEQVSCKGAKRDTAGRCRLPNGRFAKATCCAATADACHDDFVTAIDACVGDWLEDPDRDPYGEMEWDLYAQCADAEPMAPVRDELCAASAEPFCALDPEAFATTYLPGCRREATDAWLDGECVFGSTYRDLFGRAEAIVVISERELAADATLTALEAEQIVAAVRASSYEPNDVAEAFEAVDQNVINQVELWDASARRAFIAYEYGAGDNSYGRIFEHGSTTVAANINDGDLYECAPRWGAERRRCTADADCEGGARCLGTSEASPLGRCLNPALDTHEAEGTSCSAASGCPGGSGLVCAGAALGGEGLCLPAWMRGRFGAEPRVAIPDGSAAGAETTLLAYGLATVDMDVKIDLHVSHPRPSDVRVTLTNPAGNEVLVFDGPTSGANEIYLRGQALSGFSGDESVNGVWTLRATDTVAGQSGSIEEFGLEITSRWD